MTIFRAAVRVGAVMVFAVIFSASAILADTFPNVELLQTGLSQPDEAFGSVAISMSRTALSDRWEQVLAEQAHLQLSECGKAGPDCATYRYAELHAVLAAIKGAPVARQIRSINEAVNRMIAYRSDGSQDHWASAEETIASGRGDCEDIAILKMWMLRAAGVPAEAIHLVLLKDIRRGLDHAVVSIRLDGRNLILDNVTGEIRTDAEVRHYKPMISLASNGAWVHGFKPGKAPGSTVATGAR